MVRWPPADRPTARARRCARREWLWVAGHRASSSPIVCDRCVASHCPGSWPASRLHRAGPLYSNIIKLIMSTATRRSSLVHLTRRRRPGHRRRHDRRGPRRLLVRRLGPLRACNGTAPTRGALRQPRRLPTAAAREPAPQPRHPPGRGHSDPRPAQPGRACHEKKQPGKDTRRSLSMPLTFYPCNESSVRQKRLPPATGRLSRFG